MYGVGDMLKRIVIILIVLLNAIGFSACQNNRETIEEVILTEDELQYNDPDDVVEIDQTCFFRRIDPVYFQFAFVYIEGKYNVPNTLTFEEKKTYIKNENQKLFDQSMLATEGHTSSYYVSNVTQLITLSYKTKENFLSDLELLKSMVPYALVDIELHTVDDRFELNNDMTEETINDRVFFYQDYEDERESISFTVLDLIEDYEEWNDDNYVLFPESGIYNLFLSSYQEYLNYYPQNALMLTESDFDDHLLLLVKGSKATEDIIKIKAVYVTDSVELVIEVEAMSNLFPSVYNEYVALIKVLKNDVVGQTVLNPVFHTHYQSGYLAQVPFGIK